MCSYSAAPQLGQYLEGPNLTKPKADKKKKAKDSDKATETAPMIDVTHFVAAAPALVDGVPKAAMATKARFAPVGSFIAQPPQSMESAPGSGEASPAPTGGRIALNLKRKAEDEGTGTPPAKRR